MNWLSKLSDGLFQVVLLKKFIEGNIQRESRLTILLEYTLNLKVIQSNSEEKSKYSLKATVLFVGRQSISK